MVFRHKFLCQASGGGGGKGDHFAIERKSNDESLDRFCVAAADDDDDSDSTAFVFSALSSVSCDLQSKISMLRVTLRLLGNRRNGHEHLFFKFQDATTLNLVSKGR